MAGQQLRIRREGEQPDASDKSAGKKAPFPAAKTGGDRGVSEGDKGTFKAQGDLGKRPLDAGSPKPKPRREGPKPA